MSLLLTLFLSPLPPRSSTPLHLPLSLMTTPANAFIFENPIDNYEDFFISYPFLNDSSANYLILQDGVPVSSVNSICFTGIEKIEVLDENAASSYGNYDGVINIISKRFKSSNPYSSVKIAKNPDYLEFELGKDLLLNKKRLFDVYMSGILDTAMNTNFNIGYTSKNLNLRAFYNDRLTLQGTIASNSGFTLSKDFYSFTHKVKFHNHNFVFGIQDEIGFFIQGYWEIIPLLYAAPSIRCGDNKTYPKLALGYIPVLNLMAFGSIAGDEQTLGLRFFESSINYSTVNGIRARLLSPSILNLKLGTSLGKKLTDSPADSLTWTCWAEYGRDFPSYNIGINLLGDLLTNMVRIELRVIDARFFYRWQDYDYSYGLFWDFWN